MILIITGQFYTEGKPRIVANNKTDALKWLKENNFKRTKDDWNKDLFEKVDNEISIFARLDEIERVENNETSL